MSGAWSNDQLNSLFIYSAIDGSLILQVSQNGFTFTAPNRKYDMSNFAFTITPVPADGSYIQMTTSAGFGGILFLEPVDSNVVGAVFTPGFMYASRDEILVGPTDTRPFIKLFSPVVNGLHSSQVIVHGQALLSPTDDSYCEIVGSALQVDGLLNLGSAGATWANTPGTAAATGTTNSTAFTNTLAVTGTHGAVFVAPPSGNVFVIGTAAGFNNTINLFATIDFEVRDGNTIGSGTIVRAATDSTAGITQSNPANIQGCLTTTGMVTGLTAGNTYNATMCYRAAGGASTVSFNRRNITVLPMGN